MKLWVALASAFLLLSACGSSKEAKEALSMMNLDEGGHGYIRYDSESGWGGKMTFKGVRIRLGDGDNVPKLRIETMVFDGLKMSGEHAVFSELTLTGVTPEFPDGMVPAGVSMRMDKVALKKPNEDMAKAVSASIEWLGDPKGEPPAQPDVQKWTFGQLLLGGLSVKGPVDENGAKADIDFHVNEVSMTDARDLHQDDPQFGKFLIQGVALKADHVKVDSEGVSGKAEFALGEFSITDLKHMTPQKQELGKVLLSGLTLKGEGATDQGSGSFEGGLKEISLSDLRQMTMDGQDFGRFAIAGLSFKGDGVAGGAKAHIDGGLGELSLAGLKSDIGNGKVAFDKFLLSGVNANISAEDAKSPGHASFALGELSGTNVRDLKVGAFVLSGLKGDFDVPDDSSEGKVERVKGKLDFGALNIANLNLGLYGQLVEAGAMEGYDRAASGKALADVLRTLPSPIEPLYDSLTWTGMNADIGGFKISSTRLEQKVERDAKGVATHVFQPTASVAFSVDPAASTPAREVSDEMTKLGLKNVELHFGSDVRYDPAQDTTRLVKFNVGSSGLAELTVGGGAKGLTRGLAAAVQMMESEDNTDALVKTDFDNMQVIDFDLALTDQKLLDLIFSSMARDRGDGATASQIRADAAQQMLAMKADMQKAGIDAALASDISTALAGFVQKPGTLHIKLAPPRPTPMRMLGDKGVTKASLGFSATFTPAQ